MRKLLLVSGAVLVLAAGASSPAWATSGPSTSGNTVYSDNDVIDNKDLVDNTVTSLVGISGQEVDVHKISDLVDTDVDADTTVDD